MPRTHNEIMIIFPTNDVGKTGSLCKRMEKDPYLIPYTKVNSKWIKDLNMRLETVEHLEENIGKKLLDVGPGNDVLDMTPKAQATKGKIDKWDYIKLQASLSIQRRLVPGDPTHTKIH